MTDPLVSVFKTVDNIKSAIELGNSEMVVADTAKLIAQLSAAIAAEGYLRTYSALDGFGRWLTLWRLGKAIDGSGVEKQKALAGYVASEAVGFFIDEARKLNVGGWIYDLIHEKDFLVSRFLINNPDPTVKDIKYVPWVDPLVLDLDGDGLEITPLSAGVQFDTNADTIRTATAWVGADDGLLVLDRNGNGQIDSARELFGDETVLEGGKKAAHGFAALAELDVGGAAGATGGAGDGIFDAKDAQFGAVRVWRDLNQDGISQAGELQSMAEAGIASIALASTATETSYGDAQLVQSGSFARADGSEGQAGSFILAVNHAVATHPPIPVSAEAAALPQVQGSGWVRGLQEAATLNPQLLGLYGTAGQARQTGARHLPSVWTDGFSATRAANSAIWRDVA